MMTLKATEPTFGGSDTFLKLGARRYGFPPGTLLSEPHRGRLAYVKLFDNSIHCLTPAGEVELPEALRTLIAQSVFGEPGHG